VRATQGAGGETISIGVQLVGVTLRVASEDLISFLLQRPETFPSFPSFNRIYQSLRVESVCFLCEDSFSSLDLAPLFKALPLVYLSPYPSMYFRLVGNLLAFPRAFVFWRTKPPGHDLVVRISCMFPLSLTLSKFFL